MKKKHNILIFNGGRGAKNIINVFKKNKNINIYSIVNAYDDGKSTGNLRDIFGTLGPSDIRKVQKLFIPNNSNYKEILKLFDLRIQNISKKIFFEEIDSFIKLNKKDLFGIKLPQKKIKEFLKVNLKYFYNYIFSDKSRYRKLNVKDLSLINCVYVSSILKNNNKISKSIDDFNRIFNLSNSTFCISDDIRFLCALEKPNRVYFTEEQIVEKRSNSNIQDIYLLKKKLNVNRFKKLSFLNKKEFLEKNNSSPKIDNEIIKLIKKANAIIYSPGTQHSSLYPTYKHNNLAKYIKRNKTCKKIFITNIGADYETPNYDSYDYVNGAFKYLSNKNKKYKFEDFFDYILVNNPGKNTQDKYVKHYPEKFEKIKTKIKFQNFESKVYKDEHDGKKIYNFIMNLL
tara:strand:- start:5009 stop:6205 length:1197 start_codon:yes stop_codon:yes gene_type:complete